MSLRRVLIAFCVVFLVSASGCSGILGGGSDQRADQIRERAIETGENVSTYRMEVSMTVDTGDASSETEIDAIVNRTARRMKQELSLDVNGRSESATAYIVGQTMHIRQGGYWQSQDVSDREIWSNDRIQQQRQLIENATVTFDGNATVNGVETFVITVDPDEESLKQAIQNSPGDSTSMEDVTIEEATVTQYISHDRYYIRKTEMNMTIEQDGETAEVSMTMTLHDINEPVTIDLPEDA